MRVRLVLCLPTYNEIQNLVTSNVLALFLVNKKQAWANGTNVAGIAWNPNYGPHFRGADITKSGPRQR